MASRSVSAAMVLMGFLMVAALCLQAEAGPDSPALGHKDNVKLILHNRCSKDVRLVVGVDKLVLDCKKAKVAVLGPVVLKLQALHLLKVRLLLFGKNGKLLKLDIVVNLNLRLLGSLVRGVRVVVLDVEEVEYAKYKVIKLVCGAHVLAKARLAI